MKFEYTNPDGKDATCDVNVIEKRSLIIAVVSEFDYSDIAAIASEFHKKRLKDVPGEDVAWFCRTEASGNETYMKVLFKYENGEYSEPVASGVRNFNELAGSFAAPVVKDEAE